MKPAVLKKTAQVTVLMLIISVLVPVLAFAAAGFKDLKFESNNTVTGTVYSDVYSVNATVYAFDPNGNRFDVSDATYVDYDVTSNVYNYKFTVTSNTYDYVRVQGPFGTSVDGKTITGAVYDSVQRNTGGNSGNSGCCSGGGGGGGGGIWGSETIYVNSDGSVDADQLKNSFKDRDKVTLKLSGDIALIPAKALVDYVTNSKKVLVIVNNNGSYSIPINALKLQDLASKLSVTTDELKLKVTIAKANDATKDGVDKAAKALGGTVASNAVDFDIVGLGKDQKTAALDLGNNYISRILPLSKAVDSSKATGVLYNPTTGKLSFVPAVFSSSTDGKGEATLKRNGSSIYAVIEMNKTFSDINGHWAESYVKLLANKLVVDGVTDTTFQPERNITRAEFAALVVRALGLDTNSGSSTFKDVAASEWYASVVAAAANAKLVDGYEDGTFRPNATINREELAAMVVRALNYASAKPDVSADKQTQLLAKFKDASKIVWAKNEIATAIDAGIIDGMTDDTLGARDTATRAQSATMLKRLLSKASFINN
ncbi:S-layer homology domain-containing protein [Paenibacillus tianmuensis]|uniref:S-layer homology domain-containing protein n=1 Tax=Paenibacillus tianmuensis TaxID=624147 RepID=A0A1G4PFW3_9BACL|nr:S-layer homology domain-containing protein [Paenibacillus tianmuensis]SCW31131.1 S-layer homology domain-containing protein [Paenibacillus tianmuensis]